MILPKIHEFLTKWKFEAVPCRSPMDCLIEHGFFKSTRTGKRYRFYIKRFTRNRLPAIQYWLLFDKTLYATREQLLKTGMNETIISELETIMKG